MNGVDDLVDAFLTEWMIWSVHDMSLMRDGVDVTLVTYITVKFGRSGMSIVVREIWTIWNVQ